MLDVGQFVHLSISSEGLMCVHSEVRLTNFLLLPPVALNYQTQDVSMDLNDGKFQQNGRSGYILKPRAQREGETHNQFQFHFRYLFLHP